MRTPFPAFLAAAAACFLGTALHAAPPGPATPYMFVGRVMDSSHAGFDTNRVCVLSASNAVTGTALAQTRTFFRENTRNNYALRIPVATAEADGYAVHGDSLAVTATDDKGREWQGVIPDSLCGEPGGVREVDIVLGEDSDGDGIDDELFAQLLAQWESSEYWKRGEEFDPHADHDGDGVATLDEALAGTDPFDETDVLAITSFSVADSTVAVEFPTVPGRFYELQTATDLAAADWQSATPPSTLSTPSSARSAPATLYLLPSTNPPAFFRLVTE